VPDLTALKPIGARLSGCTLDSIDDNQVGELRRLLSEHGVLVWSGQDVDNSGFLRFLRSFGPTMFTVGETPVPGYPDLNVVTNVGRKTPPRSTFHTDTSYVRTPPAYTALRAVAIPRRGGQTLFSNQYVAYDSLPPRVRQELDGRTITHVVTGVRPGPGQETSATHPIFRVHPISGRRFLFLTNPERCVQVSGMSRERAASVVAYLFHHSTRDDNVYRHVWAPGDVVMWDNRCVLHRADHTGVVGDRVMHRGMVADGIRE
jgi:taurine dioxygenase